MKNPKHILRLVSGLLMLSSPLSAHAAGGQDISSIFISLVTASWPLWVVAAIMVLIIAGFAMVTTSDEARVDKAKNTIVAVVSGGILITIIVTLGPLGLVGLVYNGTAGFILTSATSAGNIGLEAVGIAEWLMTIVVLIGILFVIVAALRAVVSFGDEAKYESVKQAVLQLILGLITIASAYIIKTVFYDTREPSLLINLFTSKVLIVLGLVTTVAIAIIVYAGLRMVISLGNEEDFNAAKSLTIRAAIGIALILVSYSLVIIVATVFG
jgi:hypothetical protein